MHDESPNAQHTRIDGAPGHARALWSSKLRHPFARTSRRKLKWLAGVGSAVGVPAEMRTDGAAERTCLSAHGRPCCALAVFAANGRLSPIARHVRRGCSRGCGKHACCRGQFSSNRESVCVVCGVELRSGREMFAGKYTSVSRVSENCAWPDAIEGKLEFSVFCFSFCHSDAHLFLLARVICE